MNKSFIRFKFLYYYLKSKFLKKKIYHDKIQVGIFKNYAKKHNFKKFWFLNNFPIFEYFLPKNFNKKFRYMEVGSFEGLSLLYVLNKYKKARVTSIDINDIINKKVKNFKNIKFIKSDSIIALRNLGRENKKFNYIYIDGLHNGEHVIVDAIESFKLLQYGGIMIFDDFMSTDKKLKYQTGEGLYYFLNFLKKEIQILYFQDILVIKKIRK